MHIIDPDRIVKTFEERTKVERLREIDIGFKKREEKLNIERDEALLEKLARKRECELLTVNYFYN